MDARDWGHWDLLGGGLMVTAVKHEKINRARQALYKVQHHLYHFNRELGDIRASDVMVRFDGLTQFADFFFDGLIVDWIVQSGINRSLDNTRELYKSVLHIIHQLKARLAACTNKVYLLKQDQEDLIASL